MKAHPPALPTERARRGGEGALRKDRSEAMDYIFARTTPEDRGHSSPCWVWTLAPTELGYARGAVPGFGYVRVQRAVYELANGAIPSGLHIDHLCRVRLCCNPDHLEAVTQTENNRRTAGFRAKASHCSRGHERTPETIRHNRGCKICHREDAHKWNSKRRAVSA